MLIDITDVEHIDGRVSSDRAMMRIPTSHLSETNSLCYKMGS